MTEMQAVMARMDRANTTRTIRIRLSNEDVERLRAIAHDQRRPPQDQAAWMLEQAIRAYVGPSEECGEG